MEEDYTHRDLCSATSGMLEAFKKQSEKEWSELDSDTVDEIIKAFNDKHKEYGAETPRPTEE
jgi:hypothetical protein